MQIEWAFAELCEPLFSRCLPFYKSITVGHDNLKKPRLIPYIKRELKTGFIKSQTIDA